MLRWHSMPPPRRALVIVSKAPRPGHAKTRLVPPLTPVEAADLARAFLLDTLAVGLSLGWECVSVVHPAADGALLRAVVPSQARLCAQRGKGLGNALSTAFEQHFAEGFQRVVLIDSDSPTLPRRLLHEASEQLAGHDVSIGPSADGGYYLLGLRAPRPELFEGIVWSTPTVYAETLQRARGLRVQALPEWYDVDSAADLARLDADLREQLPGVAAHTRAVMERLRLHVPG